MSNNQLHGKDFEDIIKQAMFPRSVAFHSAPTAEFDIEAQFDGKLKLPTSVKVSKNATIELADARRFFALDKGFRMIVGLYSQKPGIKEYHTIHEFILYPATLDALRGALDYSQVESFHESISLKNYAAGEHVSARKKAKATKAGLKAVESDIILNPKIDSKKQRRLQCSVKLPKLISVCNGHGQHSVFTKGMKCGALALPWTQDSSKREFYSSVPNKNGKRGRV